MFVIWRVFDFLVVYLGSLFVPYLGFFPYKEELTRLGLPHFITALANFDGLHYILIARQGYSQFEQAFFPLYPILIKAVSAVTAGNHLVAGLVISNVSFVLALLVLNRVLKPKSLWFFVLLLAFPTSFFFGSVYNEGLFLLLFSLTLYFLKKQAAWPVVISAIAAALTRIIGVFLVIPIFFSWLKSRKIGGLFLILSPVLGLAIYCAYLFATTGDPLFFLSSQPAFGANRSTHLIFLPQVYWRYLKIFIIANWNFQYFVSLIEFFIFSSVFFVLALDFIKQVKSKVQDQFRIGLNLFSLANIILPTLTGTFSSIPRYALLSLSFFLYLSEIKNRSVKIAVAVIFLVFHIILLAFFSQGYFIS